MTLSKVDLANQVENQLPQGLVANNLPYRNIIINGDMSIAQRGTSVAGITGAGYYTLDRYRLTVTSIGTWTMSQDSDVPSGQGFAKSMKLACTTADASPASADLLLFASKYEGQNLQYLKFGTANAESLTASFWVKSNKTGTYILELNNSDNSRTVSKPYTIDVADTWEKKTITYAGDTVGALDNDNNTSLNVNFWLGAGTNWTSGTSQTSFATQVNANRAYGQTVNLADSISNYINITGFQLEAGTTASDFEFLPYDVNLGRCYRYYYQDPVLAGDNGLNFSLAYDTSQSPGGTRYPVTMRTSPTITTYNVAGVSGGAHRFGSGDITGVSVVRISATGFTQLSGTFVAGSTYVFLYKADAEL